MEKDDAFTVRVDKPPPPPMGQRDVVDRVDNGCKDSLVKPDVVNEKDFVDSQDVLQKVLQPAVHSLLKPNDWSVPLPHFILFVPFSDELQKTETERVVAVIECYSSFQGVPYQQPQHSITYFAAVSLDAALKRREGHVDAIGQNAGIIMRTAQFFF